MKTPTSPENKRITEKKTAVARRTAKPTHSIPINSVRLEVMRPVALAVIEPLHGRSHVALRHVRFGYFKPEAREVNLVGSFNGWNTQATPMHRDEFGDWAIELELPPGEHHYRFFVDGEWRDDPTAQQTALNAFGSFDAIMVVT